MTPFCALITSLLNMNDQSTSQGFNKHSWFMSCYRTGIVLKQDVGLPLNYPSFTPSPPSLFLSSCALPPPFLSTRKCQPNSPKTLRLECMRGLHPIFADLWGSAWCSTCSVTHLIEGYVILHPTQDPASRTLFSMHSSLSLEVCSDWNCLFSLHNL